MKRTIFMPLAAALMLSTAAIAQESPPAATEQPNSPAAADPTPAPAAPSAVPSVVPPEVQMPSTSAETTSAPILTDEQANALKSKAIWSSDEKNIGEVADVVRDSDGRVKELHADIGGFLGFGQTRVRIGADEFRMVNDRIELTRTEAQVETLPKVMDN